MNEPKNIVIITAKGGNQSVENKNVIPILGVPVVLYPLRAAKLSVKTEKVFVSSEDRQILALAAKEGAEVLVRPAELSAPHSQHRDVILHAVDAVAKQFPSAENFIVLLGNTVMVSPGLIDRAFNILDSGEADSCATVWKAQDDHPYRALKVSADGYAESFLNVDCSSNRQSYPSVYYYDQGIWAFKKHCAFAQKGPPPWVWLGEKCKLIERPWVTGRDIHSWIDISASVWYLTSIQVNDYADYKDL